MFNAQPYLNIINELKSMLKIPVIYNGGIKSPEDALFYQKKTGCEVLMIGQATIGNPWIFKQIKDLFQNGSYSLPTIKERKEIILKHSELVKKYYGDRGFVIFRPQLAAYLRGLSNSAELRFQAVRINSLEDVKNILSKIKA